MVLSRSSLPLRSFLLLALLVHHGAQAAIKIPGGPFAGAAGATAPKIHHLKALAKAGLGVPLAPPAPELPKIDGALMKLLKSRTPFRFGWQKSKVQNKLNLVSTKLNKKVVNEHYLSLLQHALTGLLSDEAGSCVSTSAGGCSDVKPIDPAVREKGGDWPPYGHTVVGLKRLNNLRAVIEDTVKNNVPGDFADLGVWRGGTSIYAAALYRALGESENRKVHMFDVFDEEPELGGQVSFFAVPQESVTRNFKKYRMPDHNVQSYKGLFKDSLPAFAVTSPKAQFSVLRIDANHYDSYQDALYYLYPRVPVGGYVIFDDLYSDPDTAGKAWLDFKEANGVPEEVTRIDDNAAFFQKTTEVMVDLTHMKPPQDVNVYRPPAPIVSESPLYR